MPSSYDFIVELSRNEKPQKYRIILSQHTNNLHKWLGHLHFDMFSAAMFIFFREILNMCKPRIRFYLVWWASTPGFEFYGSVLCRFPGWPEVVKAAWFRFPTIRTLLSNEIFHYFRMSHEAGCPLTWPVRSI